MTASYENTVFLGIEVHKKTFSVFGYSALFTFTVRISVGRKRSDVVVCDEGIAPAMSEEQNATDDPFAVDRKLTAKVNKAGYSIWCHSKEREDLGENVLGSTNGIFFPKSSLPYLGVSAVKILIPILLNTGPKSGLSDYQFIFTEMLTYHEGHIKNAIEIKGILQCSLNVI